MSIQRHWRRHSKSATSSLPDKGTCREIDNVYQTNMYGPRSAVGNVSGYRCVSDCRSRGREFDPGPVPYFVEIDHEMISTVILPLPLIHSRRVVVSYKGKYEHELLVNRLFKPAQEKVLLGELTVPQ